MANLFLGNRNAWDAPPNEAIRAPLLADVDEDEFDEERPEDEEKGPEEPVGTSGKELSDKVQSERSRPAGAESRSDGAGASKPVVQVDEAVEAHLDDDIQRQQGETSGRDQNRRKLPLRPKKLEQ